MFEKLKRVRPVTLAALVVALVALVAMVLKGWTPEEIGAAAAALVGVMSQMHRLVGPEPPEPPSGALVPLAIGFACVLGVAACSSAQARAAAAEAEYNHELGRCLDAAPSLASRANVPTEERQAAWASYDACLAEVRKRWGVTEAGAPGGAR